MMPRPDARISPSPRKASDAATIISSASVNSQWVVIVCLSSECRQRQAAHRCNAAIGGLIGVFATVHKLIHVHLPAVIIAGTGDIALEVGQIPAIVRRTHGRMSTLGCMHHALYQIAFKGVEPSGVTIQFQAVYHLFRRDDATLGGASHQMVEIGIGAG